MKKTFAIACGITLLSLASGFLFPVFFNAVDFKIIDSYFRLRGPLPHNEDIVLVTIDEKSINALGRWPWPRSTMAQLVEKLAQYEVKTAGFDITFSETTPEDSSLAQAFQKLPQAFLGYFFYLTPEEATDAKLGAKEILENDQTIFPSRISASSRQLEDSGRGVFGVQTNVPEISKSLKGDRQGFFNIFQDADGAIRSGSLLLFYKENVYPSLALQIASFAKGFSPIPLFNNEGSLGGLALGDTKVPLSASGDFFINYRGPAKTFSHISAVDVLEEKIPAEKLKNKIVLIGATAIGIYDMRVTPMDANYPGLEISANIIDNILTGDFLVSDATSRALSFGLVIFAGLFLGLLLPRFKPLTGFLIFLVFVIGLAFGGYLLFLKQHLLIYNFRPELNAFLVYGGITVYHYFIEERERRKIRKTFQFYLSPSVIKTLLEHPEQLKLGGERKELTVLFSDIRGFTTKSEKLPPEKLVQLLNDYFTEMTDVVFKYEGTLDKYMGDAIMAVFGAPLPQKDHALRASLTALEMADCLHRRRKEWCEKYGIEGLEIGIGIHTGLMVVGNMGSAKRFNYTVIGDAVNLASRIEGLNKDYGTQILISEATFKIIENKVQARKIGPVQVKGKTESVVVYELNGLKTPVS
ncbi:MAG: adenylate/guanylate cyclase domain-containing protein [Deltaproteobacteria bacterium]|nr:adenylate/guanylate cyclase domain-containing protein [Deltaproteobacteria bacterium]